MLKVMISFFYSSSHFNVTCHLSVRTPLLPCIDASSIKECGGGWGGRAEQNSDFKGGGGGGGGMMKIQNLWERVVKKKYLSASIGG